MIDDLNALILIGGKSSRMGRDKSALKYHQKPQVEHLFRMVAKDIQETYISVRKGQSVPFTDELIVDSFDIAGPLNGLLSAHNAFPSKAWLVLAVDLPFITEQTISQLIDNRDCDSLATTMTGIKKNLPEPLVAIWEPKGLAMLNDLYQKGQAMYPTEFLKKNKVTLVKTSEADLFNVNDQTDYQRAIEALKKN